MMPTWKACLQAIVLLSIAGFVFIIVSGFWHVLALLLIAAAVLWIWFHWSATRK